MTIELKNRVVSKLERAGHSKNGNPCYRFTLENGATLLTKPDALIAYSLVEGSSFIGETVTLDIDGRGRVVYIEKETESA